ncbi:MAG TPA: DUF559 domain-containing protein [Caulobacteraceae bacterium]
MAGSTAAMTTASKVVRSPTERQGIKAEDIGCFGAAASVTLSPCGRGWRANARRVRGRTSLSDLPSLGMTEERSRKLAFARRMRKSPVATEDHLWRLLRDRRLGGMKFRRQVPLGRYIVDFVCLRHRLIIEADGPFHDPSQDAERDAWLTDQGFKVMRFKNDDLFAHRDEILDQILRVARIIP